MNLFTVFSPRIAAALVLQGFEIVKRMPSKKIPGREVFMFENTLDFQIALQKLSNK